MKLRRLLLPCLFLMAAVCWRGLDPARAPAAPGGIQQPADQAPATAPGVIKAEANLVLVDVIATDKKGNYIRDLEGQDFRVFEDDKEQPITSFSRAQDASPVNAPPQRRYLVLFFDNATMAPSDQQRARLAAAQFIEKTASTDHLMAVADFGGSFRIGQNFTANVEALKRAVAGVRFSAVRPNEPGQTTEIAAMGPPSMVQVRADFAARSVLLAIRNLAKSLQPVPGRKTVILFSGGFGLNPERESELKATIDAANKANVAIYPIDVRGLAGLSPGTSTDFDDPARRFPGLPPGAALHPDESPFPHDLGLVASRFRGLTLPTSLAQRPEGSGGGGDGGRGGGGTGGGTGGTGGGRGGGGGAPAGGFGGAGATPGGAAGVPGAAPGGGTGGNTGGAGFPGGARGGSPTGNRFDPYGPNQPGNPNFPSRSIIPPLLESATTNQQVLHALATGTGGFTIFNTNDFLAGLTKIAKDLGEYYVLGYVPSSTIHDGSYHRITVKVNRKGMNLRYRNGYYDVKSPDILRGKPEGKVLEELAASPQPGNIPVSLNAPYFYTSADVARVNLALDVPLSSLAFEKQKGKYHSEVNVLGIAYREDESVGARFSDTLIFDLEKNAWKDLAGRSYSYQNNFNIAPGKYRLKVVLSAGGQRFGKFEIPLAIEPYDGKKFHLSGLALSNQMQQVSQLIANLEAALLEERTPLVVGGTEVVPSPNNRFKRSEKVGLYLEVYEPLPVVNNSLRVGVIFNVIDRKTSQQVFTSNTILVNKYALEGNPVIPIGLFVPVDQLRPGDYRLEVRARDSAGNVSPLHTADFSLE